MVVLQELANKPNMKAIVLLAIWLLAGELVAPPMSGAQGLEAAAYPAQLFAFSASKEQQVRTLAKDLGIKVPSEINDFFKSAAHGDYAGVTNVIARLASELWSPRIHSPGEKPAWVPLWQPMTEVESAYTAFATGGTKYPLAFGKGIIESIPAGSIYFGGTDAGRGLVTALCESHAKAKPFYTLTQNALSDSRYMDYLRSMYGKRIYLPTTNDVQKAIEEYMSDAAVRLKHDQEFPASPKQVHPGEDIRLVDGRVQADGAVAVMGMHARIVKLILEKNPKPDFYLEESYPMELTYPYLSPHGLIFKLNHEPLTALTPAMLDADNAFWTRECQSMLGDWLKPDTSISNICAFAEAVYGRKDWSHFTGDKAYVTNEFAPKAFSKLRVSIAGLYQWRLTNKTNADDAARLRAEAGYAFRQAFALCPSSPEALFRYVSFLTAQGNFDDAILLANTTRKLVPDNPQCENLLSQLRNARAQSKAKDR